MFWCACALVGEQARLQLHIFFLISNCGCKLGVGAMGWMQEKCRTMSYVLLTTLVARRCIKSTHLRLTCYPHRKAPARMRYFCSHCGLVSSLQTPLLYDAVHYGDQTWPPLRKCLEYLGICTEKRTGTGDCARLNQLDGNWSSDPGSWDATGGFTAGEMMLEEALVWGCGSWRYPACAAAWPPLLSGPSVARPRPSKGSTRGPDFSC